MKRILWLILLITTPCSAQYYGDLAPNQIIDIKFTSRNTSGVPTTLTSGAVVCWKDNSTTNSSSGITLSTDFNSTTGLNSLRVDTSSNSAFYSAGSNFACSISAGTVGGTSVIGEVVGGFSLSYRAITIRKGVAFSNFPIWILNASGTGSTGQNVTCQISKDNGAWASTANSPTETGLGKYILNLTATETTANVFSVVCTAATGLPYRTTVTPQQ